MTPSFPHITADRRLTYGVLALCSASGLAIGAVASDLLGSGILWCWLGLAVLLGSAAAGGLKAGR